MPILTSTYSCLANSHVRYLWILVVSFTLRIVSLTCTLAPTCWAILQRKSHFNQNVPRGYIVITFEKKTAQKPVGSLWKKILVSFTILFTMYPAWIWATHWEFFHKISCNVITMSPADFSQWNHNEITLWLNFTTYSQRILWVYGWIHCDYIAGYLWKKPGFSFTKNPLVFVLFSFQM